MKSRQIAILVDAYSANGGASKSIRECVNTLQTRGHKVLVLCSKISSYNAPFQIELISDGDSLKKVILKYNIDTILYFKAAKSLINKAIFSRFIDIYYKIGYRIPIITIVCQQPSNPSTILLPKEIKYSDHLIFIDKTAYRDSLYNFIPVNKKSWTYLTMPDVGPNPLDKYIKSDYSIKNECVVFGRGSSFNKCPNNILEPFDNIKISYDKIFIIVGVPTHQNWLSRKIKKRKSSDIITYPLLNLDEWMNIVTTFDVGLYYLPKNAHSSIDGTLGQMMRAGVPVIVGGAPAPKERIIHGVNGYIADSISEIKYYAELLVNNQELRETIGKNARASTIELNRVSWIDKLESIIDSVHNCRYINSLYIPFVKSVHIYAIHFLAVILAWITRPINKLLEFLGR